MSAATPGTPATLDTNPNRDPSKADIPRIVVPKPLSEAQVRGYVEEGFAVVRSVVTRAEMDEISADIVKMLRGGYEKGTLKPLPATMSDEEVMRSFLGLMQPHYLSPVIMNYVKHARICGMLSQLTAAHVPYWDGSVKCMQSMVFTKPPGFPGQAWHQDEIYIHTRDRSLIGAWIALDDATVQNGCLYVVPKSHRMGYLYPMRPHTRPGEWDFAGECYGFDASVAIPVEVKAGDAIFFHGYLLHGSFMNRSQIYRRAMVNHYANAWSYLPSGTIEDHRRVVPVAGIDPYWWKGYDALPPGEAAVRPREQRPAPPAPTD